jgi:hypothetical protein
MKGILEFNLPEDAAAFKEAQKGTDYLCALQDYDNYLRGRLKHEDLTKNVREALQAARDKLFEELKDRGLELWT